MPWQITDRPMKRAEFILEYRKGCWSMTDLCESFGISRNTGYKLIRRFREGGFEALQDQSRAPHRHPNKTPGEIAQRIVEVREEHPTWGVKKILAWLTPRDSETSWPARSTTERILSEAKLIKRRKRKRDSKRLRRPLPEAVFPNNLWCQDYKGWFRVGDGRRCDPYTLTDARSRAVLRCAALVSPKLEDVQKELEKAFKEYGLPDGILSDNGPPFGSTGVGGLTRLGVWLLRLKVTPHFIEPGHPEQNGRHERFHRTLKLETATPPRATIRAQQMAFNRFCRVFNEERPHEALDMATPLSVYRSSPRSYPTRLPCWEYPADYETRKVRKCGTIKWYGQPVRIGSALIGETIGIEAVGDGVLRIHLGALPLGHFHDGSHKVIPLPPEKVSPMCPGPNPPTTPRHRANRPSHETSTNRASTKDTFKPPTQAPSEPMP